MQILSSYGAGRTYEGHGAEALAAGEAHADVAAWLAESRDWTSPLHHLRVVAPARALALLRGGADLHAAARAGAPTPLSLARGLRAAGEAGDGTAAALVLRAAEPWSPATHHLLPAAARAWAVSVLRLGTLLSRRFGGEEVSFSDAWKDWVMPHAIARGSSC